MTYRVMSLFRSSPLGTGAALAWCPQTRTWPSATLGLKVVGPGTGDTGNEARIHYLSEIMLGVRRMFLQTDAGPVYYEVHDLHDSPAVFFIHGAGLDHACLTPSCPR